MHFEILVEDQSGKKALDSTHSRFILIKELAGFQKTLAAMPMQASASCYCSGV
jgi:hypothetical protein